MKVSAIEQDFAYLAARGDNRGSFVDWLKTLNVKVPGSATIPDLIAWGWVRPDFRILLPDRYFLDWPNYPSQGSDREVHDDDVWAGLFWYSAGTGNGFLYQREPYVGPWFVHPFNRAGSPHEARIRAARTSDLVSVAPKKHPNGNTFFPWIDYFPYWKAYELVEVLRAVRNTNPLLVGGDLTVLAENLLRNSERLGERRRATIERIHSAWEERRPLFALLAAYRAMRAALSLAQDPSMPLTVPVEPWELDPAVQELGRLLSVTPALLEDLIPRHLLTLAKEWRRWEKDDGVGLSDETKGQIQKDTLCAMEWLCILGGKTIDHYYDLWRPEDWEPRPELSLTEALPLDFRGAEDYFLTHFLRVRRTTPYDSIPPPARLQDGEVTKLVRVLRKKSWMFTDWLLTYRRFHEALGGPPAWDWAGVTEDALLHDLTLLPIFTEKMILDLTAIPISPEVKGLAKTAVKNLEASDPRFAGAWQLASPHWYQYTNLKAKPVDPFGVLHALTIAGPDAPAALAKAILFFGLSRNYFAHHFYQHRKLIGTPNGGALMAGVITTTLYLAAPYCGIR